MGVGSWQSGVDNRLSEPLERLYSAFNHERSATDPIELVRPYETAADREIAGFIAAGLAVGTVQSVIQSATSVLEAMGPSPSAFVRRRFF